MSENRKRNVSLTIRMTAEEKANLIAGMKKSNCNSLREYICSMSKGAKCIVISEVADYDEIYKKIGVLSNQISKALNTVQKYPNKYKDLIAYFEKNDAQVLKAITHYSKNLDNVLSAYLDVENFIEIKKDLLIKEYKNKAKV